jgi:hypothetical protein
MLKNMPPKLKDPDMIAISCVIGFTKISNVRTDQGADVNMMSEFFFDQIGFSVIEPINCTLHLADGSSRSPVGIVRDLQVKVDKFLIPCDFVIVDMRVDPEAKIILVISFLPTVSAVIDVKNGLLTLNINEEQIQFNAKKIEAHPCDDELYYRDKILEESDFEPGTFSYSSYDWDWRAMSSIKKDKNSKEGSSPHNPNPDETDSNST